MALQVTTDISVGGNQAIGGAGIDLALLDEVYKVTKIQAVDMFPHTHHVENVALFELKK